MTTTLITKNTGILDRQCLSLKQTRALMLKNSISAYPHLSLDSDKLKPSKLEVK